MTEATRTPHVPEEDLILLYYAEAEAPAAIEAHLDGCPACRAEWQALCASLDVVADGTAAPGLLEPTPARVESVWLRLAPRLSARPGRRWARFVAPGLAAAAALAFAFWLGRQSSAPAAGPAVADAGASQRILLVAVGEHLERSQMLLVELANAPAAEAMDIGSQQEWATELVSANRLYRQTAARSGEPGVASVLEELERVLIEVAHGPAQLDAAAVAQLQRRIEARGLLFKVRVLETRMRGKQKREAPSGAVS